MAAAAGPEAATAVPATPGAVSSGTELAAEARAVAEHGDCDEAAELPDGQIGVRDSKSPHGPILRFTPEEWNAFTAGIRNGEFDHLPICRFPPMI